MPSIDDDYRVATDMEDDLTDLAAKLGRAYLDALREQDRVEECRRIREKKLDRDSYARDAEAPGIDNTGETREWLTELEAKHGRELRQHERMRFERTFRSAFFDALQECIEGNRRQADAKGPATMTTTRTYRISNTVSGADLGLFTAASEAEALDKMAKDAGYRDYAAMQAEVPADEGEIAVIAE